jgi:hypothetical protein
LTVNHPLLLSPGASRNFFASLRIPQQLASIVPVEIEIITLPDDVPIEAGAREEDIVQVHLIEKMGMVLIAPAFGPVTADPFTQTVTLDEINAPTFWSWTLIAPEALGPHEIELRVYQIVGEQRKLAIPPRIYEIEVAAVTATPGPTVTPVPLLTPTLVPTATPVPTPFIQTPWGWIVMGTGLVVLVVVGVYLGKGYLPFTKKKVSQQQESYPGERANIEVTKRQRLLTLQGNLEYLKGQAAKYGSLEVPLKLHNEIAEVEKEIEAVQRELKELEEGLPPRPSS